MNENIDQELSKFNTFEGSENYRQMLEHKHFLDRAIFLLIKSFEDRHALLFDGINSERTNVNLDGPSGGCPEVEVTSKVRTVFVTNR